MVVSVEFIGALVVLLIELAAVVRVGCCGCTSRDLAPFDKKRCNRIQRRNPHPRTFHQHGWGKIDNFLPTRHSHSLLLFHL